MSSWEKTFISNRFVRLMRLNSSNVSTRFVVLFFFAICCPALIYQLKNQIIYPESVGYFNHYTNGDLPLHKKIFDFCHTEVSACVKQEKNSKGETVFLDHTNQFGSHVGYRARELSYLIDFIDYKIVTWSWRHFIHFTSALYFPILLLALFLNFYFARKCFGQINVATVLLVSGLFVTASPVFISSPIYRTAKALSCLMIVLFSWKLILNLRTEKGNLNKVSFAREFFSFLLVGILLALSDEQGLLWLGTAGAVYGFCFIFANGNRQKFIPPLAAICIALIARFIYSQWLGPYLVYLTNNYHPPITDHLNFRFSFETVRNVAFYLAEVVGYFLGSLPAEAVVFFLAALCVLLFFLSKRALFGSILGLGLLYVGYFVMGQAHPPIFYSNHLRRVYYFVPVMGMLLVIVTYGTQRIADSIRYQKFHFPLNLALLLLVIANMRMLPRHIAIYEKPFSVEFKLTRELSNCIRGQSSTSNLNHEGFEKLCRNFQQTHL